MRSLIIFYVLVVYVFISFFWWSYLLFGFNREISNYERTESNNHENVDAGYKARNRMILGEGAVFLVLMVAGVVMLHKSLKKEALLNKQQKDFLLSVTHELKSPLASIKLAIETLKKRSLTDKEKDDLFAASLEDVERLHDMMDNLLIASRLEQASYQDETIDFSDLTRHVTEKFSSIFKDINLQTKVDKNITLKGDKATLQAMLFNLLENASKYSKDNKDINLSLETIENKALLSVSDQGIGIPDKEKKNIFKKFYRVHGGLTADTKGTGLGLYIVNQIVSNHKGTIKVKDNTPSGSIFEIYLPLA